jgi:hypothetical protein
MGGYIGTKAVNLSTTGADINGDANVDGTGTFTELVANGTITSTTSVTGDFNFYATTTGGGAYRIYPDAATTANPTWLHQSNSSEDQAWVVGGVERMRIDSSGNVGIGTASPTYKLEVSDGTRTAILTPNSTLDGVFVGVKQAKPLVFGTTDTERMRIDASGNMLLGTATNLGSSRMFVKTAGGGTGITTQPAASGTYNPIIFKRDTGVNVGVIQSNDVGTTYSTSSDYRLKDNITPIQGASDIVKSMRPATYTFKEDGSWADGFIAHELQELHPVAVTGCKDGMVDEEYEVTPAVEATFDAEGVELTPAVDAVMGTRSVPDYQGVDYSKLTPILTAALQEALNKIDELTARIEALEAV